jgi:hypothetical protein
VGWGSQGQQARRGMQTGNCYIENCLPPRRHASQQYHDRSRFPEISVHGRLLTKKNNFSKPK